MGFSWSFTSSSIRFGNRKIGEGALAIVVSGGIPDGVGCIFVDGSLAALQVSLLMGSNEFELEGGGRVHRRLLQIGWNLGATGGAWLWAMVAAPFLTRPRGDDGWVAFVAEETPVGFPHSGLKGLGLQATNLGLWAQDWSSVDQGGGSWAWAELNDFCFHIFMKVKGVPTGVESKKAAQ